MESEFGGDQRQAQTEKYGTIKRKRCGGKRDIEWTKVKLEK